MILLVKLDHGTPSKSKNGPDSLGLLKLSAYFKSKNLETRLVSCRKKLFLKEEPEAVCYSPLFGFRLKKDLQYISAFQKRFPRSKLMIGGVQASLRPETFKRYFPKAEIAVGLQDWDTISPDYAIAGKEFSYGFTSRGCVRRCEWCIVPKTEGKIRTIDGWKSTLGEGHTFFSCMDNNILASGAPWFESVMSELEARKIKVDFNQALDCRIFVKEGFAEIFKRYLHVFQKLRFAWDASSVDKYALKTLELFERHGLKTSGQDTFLMLYGNGEDPGEIWRRLKLLTSYDQKIKPIRFLDLKTGEGAGGWPKAFAGYMALVAGVNNVVTPGQFNEGLFGRNEGEFLNCLRLGSNVVRVRKTIGRDAFVKGSKAYDMLFDFIRKGPSKCAKSI